MKKTVIIFSSIILCLLVAGICGFHALRPTVLSMMPEDIQRYDELQEQIYIDATIVSVNDSSFDIEETETHITRVPISEDTVLLDSVGNKITLSRLIPGQRVQLCVSSSVREQLVSNLVAENTYQEISLTIYQKCYEVKIIEP